MLVFHQKSFPVLKQKPGPYNSALALNDGEAEQKLLRHSQALFSKKNKFRQSQKNIRTSQARDDLDTEKIVLKNFKPSPSMGYKVAED